MRIFEYQPSMLHAKCMVIDDRWGLAGSANVDMRSFRLNFEMGALVVDETFARAMTHKYLEELQASSEVTVDTLRHVSISRRLLQGAARLLSPLL